MLLNVRKALNIQVFRFQCQHLVVITDPCMASCRRHLPSEVDFIAEATLTEAVECPTGVWLKEVDSGVT